MQLQRKRLVKHLLYNSNCVSHFGALFCLMCHVLLWLVASKVEVAWASLASGRPWSGRIVSDYGLDDRTIEVRSLAEAKEFSL
jgi:hypothetical protein